MYVFCILCVSAWRGILLCFTPPDFSGVPPLVWGTQFFHCLPSTVYPPLPALDSSPLFFNETGARSSVSSAKNNFFLQVRLLFSTWHFFFCQLNDTVCRVGAWVGCKGFFAGCGGPERTPKHQRVKESEGEGYIVLPKRLGPSPAGNPSCFGFLKALVREKLRKGHRGQNH